MSNRGTQRRVAALHTADRWVCTYRVTPFKKSLEVWHPNKYQEQTTASLIGVVRNTGFVTWISK